MGAKHRSMDCDDDAFARIVLTLNGPCACSPRFAPGEAEGIKIAMPKRVPMRIVDGSVAPQARLPLCIAAQFNELPESIPSQAAASSAAARARR